MAKLTTLTHKIAIQLPLVAESYTGCSSRSSRPVRKLVVTPSYIHASSVIRTHDPNGKRSEKISILDRAATRIGNKTGVKAEIFT